MHTKDPERFEAAKEQRQAAVVRLLNIAGNSLNSRQLAAHMADQTGVKVCQLFKDPYTLWVSMHCIGLCCAAPCCAA